MIPAICGAPKKIENAKFKVGSCRERIRTIFIIKEALLISFAPEIRNKSTPHGAVEFPIALYDIMIFQNSSCQKIKKRSIR